MPRQTAAMRRFKAATCDWMHGLQLTASERAILLTVEWLNVDSQAKFMIALDDIAAQCFLPRAQTYRIIINLAERGLIRVDQPFLEVRQH